MQARFSPAFLDTGTGRVYASSFPGGRRAAVHVPEGLPDEVIATRTPSGRVHQLKDGVIAGFVRDGRFYTREEAFRTCEAQIEALLA